jgi:hypothetical protein
MYLFFFNKYLYIGRQKYGEVEAAVRAGARQDKRSSGVELASVLSSAPFGGATQPITLSCAYTPCYSLCVG